MIQRLRDEAHRFAIRFHRKLHTKAAMVSKLDTIEGIGPKTREKLLKRFGSVSKIFNATESDLIQKAGLTPRVARNIHASA